MSIDDALFQVYYNGNWEVSNGTIVRYVGGEVHTLECNPQALCNNLMESLSISLCGQRIWYKLPFENFKELKLLCNGDSHIFQRMCDSVLWTKSAEIFMEKEVADGPGNEEVADGAGNEEVDDGSVNETPIDRDDGVHREEEARVEETASGFVDEHDCHDEDTPENSDFEAGPIQYVRSKKCGGDIRLGQIYDSIPQFKEAVVDYALKEGCNVKFTRWGSEKSEVRCAVGGGCKFRIYCSYDKPVGRYMVKTCNDEHTCMKDGYSKVVKDGVICKMFLNDIRKDPTYKPKKMQEALEDRYNLVVSNDQCRKAKGKALAIIQDEHDLQFSNIKDYKQHILETNPGSTVEVGTAIGEDGIETFERIYVCFASLRESWLAHCRPIIGIDGCFLKNNVKGQLLAAVGKDVNNQFYLVAWAVVQVENSDSWHWFIKKLKDDLKLEDGRGFTLISDRQKGLINAVDQELPKVEQRMCARHIYGNLRRVFPGRELPKKLFWSLAKSFNIVEYETAIKALKDFDLGVYEAVMMRNPRNCSRAFFSCTSMCEDVSNNFSESYNNAINKTREMPLIEMLETVRRQCMFRIDLRRRKALKHQGKYIEKVANTIAEEEKHRKYCRVIPSGNGLYEVSEHIHSFRVDMIAKTCSCRRWSMTGIPCRHVLKVINMKKLLAEDYVSDWYLISTWLNIYNETIMPMEGVFSWTDSGEPRIQPPPRETTQGPAKKQKRIKGKNESPKKKKKKGKGGEEPPTKKIKLTREGRTVHCGRCSLYGHNTRSCPNVGVPVKRPKMQSESGQGEAPSQPSQASQNSHSLN